MELLAVRPARGCLVLSRGVHLLSPLLRNWPGGVCLKSPPLRIPHDGIPILSVFIFKNLGNDPQTTAEDR